MEKYYEKFLEKLQKRGDIFICGPSYKDTKLRAYAYGGLLCKIPTDGGTLYVFFKLQPLGFQGCPSRTGKGFWEE